jgi:hypothetical protein
MIVFKRVTGTSWKTFPSSTQAAPKLPLAIVDAPKTKPPLATLVAEKPVGFLF